MTNPTRTPSIGCISDGTLNPEDLIASFESELDYLGITYPDIEDGEDQDGEISDEALDWHLDALTTLMEEATLPGMYFGASEGDGACFGFWPCEDLSDFAKVSDPSELEDLPSDVWEAVYVNDHGNVAMYGRAPLDEQNRTRWVILWDCV